MSLVEAVRIDKSNKLVSKLEVFLSRLTRLAAHHVLQLPLRNVHHVIGVFDFVFKLEGLEFLLVMLARFLIRRIDQFAA